MVDIWRGPLGSSAQCLDSKLLPHPQRTDLSRPVKINVNKLPLFAILLNNDSLTSLMSPTSRCFESPLRSAGPKGPALTGVHGDVIVPAPTTPSAKIERDCH